MVQDLRETKSLSTFCIDFATAFSLDFYQQNNTQNHGTTVWDSAKLLAFYLLDSLKKPEFDHAGDIKQQKKCIELGSGCGLGGIMMAALGFETVVTDLPDVVERVLRVNSDAAMDNIKDWWYHLESRTAARISDAKLVVEPLDWLKLCERMDGSGKNGGYGDWIGPPYHYILAADCIYNIDLIVPLLRCIDYLSSHTTVVLIAMERRDDLVVDGFINQAKSFGFSAKMVPKKMLRSKLVENEDVMIIPSLLKTIELCLIQRYINVDSTHSSRARVYNEPDTTAVFDTFAVLPATEIAMMVYLVLYFPRN